jgi:hypothetical protein
MPDDPRRINPSEKMIKIIASWKGVYLQRMEHYTHGWKAEMKKML